MVRFMMMGLVGLLVSLAWVPMSPALAQSPTAELHSRAAKPRPKPKPRPSGRLLPFFDAVNNPVTVGFPRNQSVDITPLPPSLSAFDRKVLDTCGAFGSSVSTVSLRRLFTDSPEVVSRIRTAVGGEIFPGRDSDQQFRDDLLTIWSDRAGFAHIFCGEDDGQKIGGLHFVGRYLQLQEQGIAGRLANNGNQEEVQVGEIYTLGVEVRLPNRTIRDRKKGYSYVSSAEELLTEATQAFKRFPATTKQACLNTVRDPDADQPFKAVFVKTNRAIVTYYPDATPSDRDPDCGR